MVNAALVVGVWDGLDESEISRPEILFQSAPDSKSFCSYAIEVRNVYTNIACNFRDGP